MKFIRSLAAIVFAAAAFASSTRAQTVSPVPAPTIITTAPYTITKPGYYQLGADLTVSFANGSIITINSGNVTLDFAGHYISGPNNTPASQVYGVYAYERGNLTIRNGTVAYCYLGINIYGNGQTDSLNINQRIDNMLVTYCYSGGISVDTARNSQVTNCRVSSIGGSSVDNFANGITGNGPGISIVNNTINTVTSTTYYADGINGGTYVANNVISNIASTGGGTPSGISSATFAVGNSILTAKYGLFGCTKYKDNLTSNCTTPFYSGTAVGNENN